jgi:alpha-tubulin suppressor-like RCC1 family protein
MAIATRNVHTCAIADGAAYCWGYGQYGRLGNNATSQSNVPVAVDTTGVLSGKTVTAITAGLEYTCAIANTAAYCWGRNASGQLGNNSTTDSSVPVIVNTTGALSGRTVVAISAGTSHTCAIANTAAYCWGTGTDGRLGNNSTSQSNVPVAVNTTGVLSGKMVATFATGDAYTCAVASSAAYCWGANPNGQLGNNSTTGSSVPVAVRSLTTPFSTSSYRWYQNADSTTPGSPLADTNSTFKLSVPREKFRLRQGIDNGVGFSAVASGGSHSCTVISGTAYCWGRNASGQLGDGTTTDSLVPVAVNTTGVLGGKTITAISAGTSHTCAIANGAAYCWGLGTDGRLGNNSTSQSTVPVAVDTSGVLSGKTITAISAGDAHTCAIANNAAYCWGDNTSYGMLGDNSTTDRLTPVAVDTSGVLSGKTITTISAGDQHTCAVGSGAAYCWGYNVRGQLGNNSTSTSNIPVAVNTAGVLAGKTVTAIAADMETTNTHSCAIADGAAYCWGYGGLLGDNTNSQSTVPVAVHTGGVLSGKTVTAMTIGSGQTCVIANAAAYCWGTGANGRLGNNSTSNSIVPVAVNTAGALGGKTVTAITAGGGQTCVVARVITAVHCWGYNNYGQLGDNSTTTSNVPVTVATASSSLNGKTVTAISAGASHTCAIADGTAYCWGNGGSGRLGNNSTSSSSIPVAVDTSGVLSGKTVTAISAGDQHTCAIADGAAYCWGSPSNGRLGNNTTSGTYNTPVAVDTSGVLSGKTVTAISAGIDFTCAIADGAAYCWGDGSNGKLGNNTTSNSLVPVAVYTSGVLSGKTVTAIATATGSATLYSQTCVVASGAAYCWGYGGSGRLGNNSTGNSSVPVAVDTSGVLNGKTVTDVAAEASSSTIAHSCAVASGAAYCWGYGGSGRLGNNSTGNSSVPVAVDTSGVLSGKTVTAISTGNGYSCVVASGAAYCWGAGTNGKLGNNSTSGSNIPVAVDTSDVLSGKIIPAVSAGEEHACAVASGAAYCWGDGPNGKLGNNAVADSLVAVAVYKSSSLFTGSTILAGGDNYVLQYAALSAATCSAQTTGFASITTSTPIAYATNASVANGAAITTNSSDPTNTAATVAQTYRSSDGTFTIANDIPPGYVGLFDFSLKDNNATANTTYCLRIAYSSGSPIESATGYPQITTANGMLMLAIVDGSDAAVPSPSFAMSGAVVTNTCQSATGVFGTSSKKLRVFNSLSSTGWAMNIAATSGPTTAWNSGSATYDFNDPSGSPSGCNSGSDGDGIAGRLSFDPSVSTLTPEVGCATTGISKGSGAGFSQGVINAITFLTASSSTPMNCYYYQTNINMSQYIPAYQAAGSYSITMTATVVAQ